MRPLDKGFSSYEYFLYLLQSSRQGARAALFLPPVLPLLPLFAASRSCRLPPSAACRSFAACLFKAF
jgi:hypothetical protein